MKKYYYGADRSPQGQSFIKSPSSQHWKSKRWQQMQKKINQRRIFGQHFNFSRVGINKQKKYMLEEQKNTEIERSNRILFQKIKKIGQRSVGVVGRSRVLTEGHYKEDLIMNEYKTRNQNFNKSGRKESPLRTTQGGQLTQSKLSQVTTPKKLPEMNSKLIFKGTKLINGTQFAFVIYIEGNTYTILSQHGNMEHKIKMSLQHYKLLLRQSLNNKHSNIFNLLEFNGTLLQLAGTKRQQVSITQQQELTLPTVNQVPIKKYRSNTTTT